MMNFTSDGLKIFRRDWLLESPKASVVLVHGLGEHSGRYEHVAKSLNDAGYSVFSLDHRGHGLSEGQKGHVNTFEDYIKDVHSVVQFAKERHPGVAVMMLGHSMGGMIATGYALRHLDIKSLIISAPPYGVPGKSANLQLKLGALVGKLFPKIGLSNQLDPSHVCKKPEVVKNYIEDDLVHDQISLGWGTAFVKEQKFIHANIQKLSIPYLLLLAKQDLITDCAVAESLFTKVGSENKKLVVYPDSVSYTHLTLPTIA